MRRLAVRHRRGRVRSPVSAPHWWPSASCRRNAMSSPRRPGRAVSRCRNSSGPVRCGRRARPQPKPRPGYRGRTGAGLVGSSHSFVARFLTWSSPLDPASWHPERRYPPRHHQRCRRRRSWRRPGPLAGPWAGPGREPARTGSDGPPAGPAVIHAMPMRAAYRRLLPKGRREQT